MFSTTDHKVGSDDASVVDSKYNVDENCGLNDKKDERRHKQKILGWGRCSSNLVVNASSVRKMEKIKKHLA